MTTATVFTIGHSTRTLEDFVEILQAHAIATLADVRAYPASHRLPWFQGPQFPPFMTREEGKRTEALETTLPRVGIEYLWMRGLGGRRKKILDDSPNTALREDSFRNYADYMMTAEFHAAAAELVHRAEQHRTTIMCAEAQVYWHCHRMLISDFLVAHGHTVLHIVGNAEPKPHRMTAEARVVGGNVIYAGAPTLF